MRPLLPAVLLVVLALALAGCGGDDDVTVTVFAAASLRATFEDIEVAFEEQHEGVEVELVLAGSSDLVTQIQDGADADVFASADQATMDELPADQLGSDPQVFATNTLRIVTPPDDPAGIDGIQDLAGDVDLVVCAPEVPCGAAALALAEAAGVDLDPVSEEQSVTDVVGKVTSGQADAGLVYVTDALAAGDDVRTVEVPEAAGVVNSYPIATLADGAEPDLAAELVDLVLGETGQGILADAGFGAP